MIATKSTSLFVAIFYIVLIKFPYFIAVSIILFMTFYDIKTYTANEGTAFRKRLKTIRKVD